MNEYAWLISISVSVLLAAATYGALVWRVGRLERDQKEHADEDKKLSAVVLTHESEIARQRERTHNLANSVVELNARHSSGYDDMRDQMRDLKAELLAAIESLRNDVRTDRKKTR